MTQHCEHGSMATAASALVCSVRSLQGLRKNEKRKVYAGKGVFWGVLDKAMASQPFKGFKFSRGEGRGLAGAHL